MLRSFSGSVLVLLLVAPTVVAQDPFTIDEVLGYVNTVQTPIFNPGDTLSGLCRGSVRPPVETTAGYYYYIRARIVTYYGYPVSEWLEDGEYVDPLDNATLIPAGSQYEVPNPNFTSAFNYEVELRWAQQVEGGLPGPHYTITNDAFYFTY